MKESWKQIETFETYEISNLGRLRNSRGMILKPMFIAGGLATTLCVDSVKKAIRFSRAVGKAFCPSYRENLYPLYKDGNKRNCAASNLEWVPRSKVCSVPYSVNPASKPRTTWNERGGGGTGGQRHFEPESNSLTT